MNNTVSVYRDLAVINFWITTMNSIAAFPLRFTIPKNVAIFCSVKERAVTNIEKVSLSETFSDSSA